MCFEWRHNIMQISRTLFHGKEIITTMHYFSHSKCRQTVNKCIPVFFLFHKITTNWNWLNASLMRDRVNHKKFPRFMLVRWIYFCRIFWQSWMKQLLFVQINMWCHGNTLRSVAGVEIPFFIKIEEYFVNETTLLPVVSEGYRLVSWDYYEIQESKIRVENEVFKRK